MLPTLSPTPPEKLNRVAPRWFPRVKLYEPALPASPPAYRFWMLGDLQRQVQTPPGRAVNARWVQLDDQQVDYDGLPGAPLNHKPYAFTCAYGIEWRSTATTGSRGWILHPSSEEDVYRALDREAYRVEVEKLQAEIADKTKSGTSHEEESERLQTYQSLLAEIAPGAPGYFKTSYNSMGTSVSGIYYGLSAPNIPMACESVFSPEAGRSISFRLQRLKAPEDVATLDRQARHDWKLFLFNDIGAKSTCYALVLGEDGNAAEFWHFRNMAKGTRKKLLAQLRAVEDRGRLSVDDQRQLVAWEVQEQALRARARGSKLSETDSKIIEGLHEKAQQLKDSRKLTAADKKAAAELKEKLFLAQQEFRLQESARELLGKPVDFTLSFFGAGYITIASGESTFVYENKRLTGAGLFSSGLPAGCRLRIESDGGVWGLVYGHPKYLDATLWSQPFEIEGTGMEEVNADKIEWYYGGQAPAGTAIGLSLVPVRAPSTSTEGILRPGTWQLRVDLQTDGTHTPELYWVEMIRPPGELSEPVEVWDSQSPGNPYANSGNWIKDVLLQSRREQGPHLTCVLAAPGAATLPQSLAGLACDVWFYDRQEAREVPLLRSGKVVVNPQEDVRAILAQSPEGGFALASGFRGEVAFEAGGLLSFLERPCTVPFVLNGEWPNDCLRDLCFYAGLHPSLYAGIPEGDIGIPRISTEQPGRFPELKLSRETTWFEALRHSVKRYCAGWQLLTHTGGLELVEHAQRDKTAQSYGLPPQVDARSKYCLRGEWRMVQDTSATITGVTVLGAKNPLTGTRYSAGETIPQMYVEGFQGSAFWIGEERHQFLTPEEGYKSDDECLRAAREKLGITPLTPDGLTPWSAEIELDYDPELREGDVIPIFGARFLVDRIDLGSLVGRNAGQMQALCILADSGPVTP